MMNGNQGDGCRPRQCGGLHVHVYVYMYVCVFVSENV